MNQISIAIVDDHVLLRQGLTSLLKEFNHINTLFDAGNGLELLEKLKDNKPDIILLDIEMPIMGGQETLLNLRKLYPEIKVIILSTHYTESFINEFLLMGANGFLPKESDIDKIIEALNTIFEKGYYFDENISHAMLVKLKRAVANHQDHPTISFTRQEHKIIRLFCLGKSSEHIADQLFISKRTVEWHKENIYKKSGSKNLADLIKYALKSRIITDKEIIH